MKKKLLKLSKKYNFKVYQDKYFYYEDAFVILKMEEKKFFIANKSPKSKFYEIKWNDVEKVFKNKSLGVDGITFQLSYNLINFFEEISNKGKKNKHKENELIKKELKEIQDKLDFVKMIALNLESICSNLKEK